MECSSPLNTNTGMDTQQTRDEQPKKPSNLKPMLKKLGIGLVKLLCLVYAWPYYKKCFISLGKINSASQVAAIKSKANSAWVQGNDLTPAERYQLEQVKGKGGCLTLIAQLLFVLPFNLIIALALSLPTFGILALITYVTK